MSVRAYIDDTGGGVGPVFVLAGYIATAEQWTAFSNEWQALLDMKPRLERFKMSEAANWSDQQWNERLPLFYRAIENYAAAGLSISIPYDEFCRVFQWDEVGTAQRHASHMATMCR